VSDVWTCAACQERKTERPAHEHQHLFPGCGYVCGFCTRICKACWERVQRYTADQFRELLAKDHERHHQKSPPEKPPKVQIGVPQEQRKS
jgi:hypothetical protein